MEIRQVSVDERTDLMFPLQTYAFEPSPVAGELRERYEQRLRFSTTMTALVALEGGQALACAAAHPMRQNVRGRVLDMAGVASVASHPAARRRGLVRELVGRLLRQMRDDGCAVSALYPFRPSFYARFGYVGLPQVRRVSLAPEGLSHLQRAELPGEVVRLTAQDDGYDAFTRTLLGRRHGFSVFDEVRAGIFREDPSWVALARAGGETVGVLRYRIDRFGGDLAGEHLLAADPLGRALLLQFLARHVDQVSRVRLLVSADETPESWGTDLEVTTEARVAMPSENAPMARVLDVPGLDGIAVGTGAVTVEVVDDELTGGVHRLESDAGALRIEKGRTPDARLTVAGLSGLVYGVLDPVDVVTRGLGQIDAAAVPTLRTLFPAASPYVFSAF